MRSCKRKKPTGRYRYKCKVCGWYIKIDARFCWECLCSILDEATSRLNSKGKGTDIGTI
jgi:hypothetical protein